MVRPALLLIGAGCGHKDAAPTGPVAVASVTVSLAEAALLPGQSTRATATLRDGSGAVLIGRAVSWTSTNASVASVSSGGDVSALAAGTTTIVATSGTTSGSATLTVNPAPVITVAVALGTPSLTVGQTTQATATLRDANGNVLTDRAVAWNSTDNAVATVSASGLVSALSAGTATIVATSETKTGSAVLTVSPVPVATVTVTLASSSLVAGQTTQASVTLRDAGANVLTGRVVSWTSTNNAVATVSTSGLVTAVSSGSASIVATSETRTGSALLTVSPVPVASVTITFPAPTVDAGASMQATATLRDAAGNVLTGRTVTWTSSAAEAATVSASGMVNGVSVGTTRITATSEGASTSVLLKTVLRPALLAAVRQAFLNRFGVSVVDPALFDDPRAGPCVGQRQLTASMYLRVATDSSRLFWLYLSPDGSTVNASAMGTYRTPAGIFRVLSVILTYSQTITSSDLGNWQAAQASINQDHITFASAHGFASPIVSFTNTTVFVDASQVADPRSFAGISAALQAQGVSTAGYDFVASINIDPTRAEGGFAAVNGGNGFVYMGNFGQWQAHPSTSDIISIARAVYHHEIAHHWGWVHEWTIACSSPLGFEPLITSPMLFGWIDLDGDGIPEILDPTPYGRP